jgi:hypothetical protein
VRRARQQRRRRTAKVDRGLFAMATIVAVHRESIGEHDDKDEDEAIRAALAWIHGGSL